MGVSGIDGAERDLRLVYSVHGADADVLPELLRHVDRGLPKRHAVRERWAAAFGNRDAASAAALLKILRACWRFVDLRGGWCRGHCGWCGDAPDRVRIAVRGRVIGFCSCLAVC